MIRCLNRSDPPRFEAIEPFKRIGNARKIDKRPRLLRYLELVNSTVQVGLAYSKNQYDIERFHVLRKATEELLADLHPEEERDIVSWLSADSGYPTPKFDVRAVVLNPRWEVLLVREASDGRWTLPGGWSDIGDSPREAVERECLEETGLVVKARHLVGLFDKLKHPYPPQIPHAYKAIFHCVVEGGALLTETSETTGAEYFAIDSLPALSEHRTIASQLSTVVESIQQGNPTTLFD